MNDIIRNIQNRRSTRVYSSAPLPQETLRAVAEAGLYAPTAMGQQPWHLSVVRSAKMMAKLKALLTSIMRGCGELKPDEELNLFYGAPAAVLVSGDPAAIAPAVDCALADLCMMLAAESFGIGSCWVSYVVHLNDNAEGRALLDELNVPAGYKVMSSVSLGHIAEATPRAPRREGTVSYSV